MTSESSGSATGPGSTPNGDHWETLLRSTALRLAHDLASIESGLASTRAVRANGSDDDEHDPDGIPLSSVIEGLEGQRLRTVAEIRAAELGLADLKHGRYGICRICSASIPPARLEIRPNTGTCVRCASRAH